jgi:plastocyanin
MKGLAPRTSVFLRRFALCAAAVMLIAAEPADTVGGGDVTQIKQTFEPGRFETTAGAAVTFVNADDVNHNLQRVAPSGENKDYGVQKPGETTTISFPEAGLYTVMCSIHPRMKMKVLVK